jgi:hypothetical protein
VRRLLLGVEEVRQLGGALFSAVPFWHAEFRGVPLTIE